MAAVRRPGWALIAARVARELEDLSATYLRYIDVIVQAPVRLPMEGKPPAVGRPGRTIRISSLFYNSTHVGAVDVRDINLPGLIPAGDKCDLPPRRGPGGRCIDAGVVGQISPLGSVQFRNKQVRIQGKD